MKRYVVVTACLVAIFSGLIVFVHIQDAGMHCLEPVYEVAGMLLCKLPTGFMINLSDGSEYYRDGHCYYEQLKRANSEYVTIFVHEGGGVRGWRTHFKSGVTTAVYFAPTNARDLHIISC